MSLKITRPKYPLLFRSGNRYFLPMLVQLGNEVISKRLPYDRIGEIQIYKHAGSWWYQVYENPDYIED